MERTFMFLKLVACSALIVVALLCLSYSNAYGYSAAIGAKKPSPPAASSGTSSSEDSEFIKNDFAGHNWDCDTYIATDDNSNNTYPPATVPEPGTLILLGSGLIGLSRFVRRRS